MTWLDEGRWPYEATDMPREWASVWRQLAELTGSNLRKVPHNLREKAHVFLEVLRICTELTIPAGRHIPCSCASEIPLFLGQNSLTEWPLLWKDKS